MDWRLYYLTKDCMARVHLKLHYLVDYQTDSIIVREKSWRNSRERKSLDFLQVKDRIKKSRNGNLKKKLEIDLTKKYWLWTPPPKKKNQLEHKYRVFLAYRAGLNTGALRQCTVSFFLVVPGGRIFYYVSKVYVYCNTFTYNVHCRHQTWIFTMDIISTMHNYT